MKIKSICLGVLFLLLSIPIIAWTSPRAAICMASSFVGNAISSNGQVRASSSISKADSAILVEYVEKGRNRIEEVLWSTRSDPTLLFLDGGRVFGLFDYNQYGSASALPGKTCLLIGPKGMNIDVVSHELVHADIAAKLGYLKNLKLSAWVNEGVAMQVDRRKRYDSGALDGRSPRYVISKTRSEFYSDDSAEAVHNYAAAKQVIGHWINVNGADKLLPSLLSNNGALYKSGIVEKHQ